MTAFYMFRAIFLTFDGEYKGGEPPEHGASHDAHAGKPHESPLVMALPLLILAVPAIARRLRQLPDHATERLAHLLEGALPPSRRPRRCTTQTFNWAIALASTALALAGIGARVRDLPGEGRSRPSRCRRSFGPVHTLVAHKYYIDELYEDVIVRRRRCYGVVCAVAQWFDTNVVDGAVNGAGAVTRRVGDGLRWVQSG